MVSAVAVFLFTVAYVCGQVAAERKLIYVTVVSNVNVSNNASSAVLISVTILLTWIEVCGTVFNNF